MVQVRLNGNLVVVTIPTLAEDMLFFVAIANDIARAARLVESERTIPIDIQYLR